MPFSPKAAMLWGSSAESNTWMSERCTATVKRYECCLPPSLSTVRWGVNRSLQLRGWAKLARALYSEASSTGVRPLIFAAHPDDETLGASALIMRSPGAIVVYLTDGAPRDRNLRSPDAIGSRSNYVHIRLLESLAAM